MHDKINNNFARLTIILNWRLHAPVDPSSYSLSPWPFSDPLTIYRPLGWSNSPLGVDIDHFENHWSTVSRSRNRHESTMQKTNDTSSRGVPRVYRVWEQNQFKRSPARSWQHKIKKTLQPDAFLAIISFQGQSVLAFAAENLSIILSKSW